MLNSDTMCTVSCAQSCKDWSMNPNAGVEGKTCEELLKTGVICQMQACHKII